MAMTMTMNVIVLMVTAVGPAIRVVVPVSAPRDLQHQQCHPRRHEHPADRQVRMPRHRFAQAQPDGHQRRADHHRHQHVRHRGGQGQARHAAERVAAGTGQQGQRHPVVGQDRVADADAGRGQEHGKGRHVCPS